MPVDVVVMIWRAFGVDLMGFIRRQRPRWSGTLGVDTTEHDPQHRSLWVGRRQRDLDAGFELLDAHGDLQKRPANGLECRAAPARERFGAAPRRECAVAIG